METRNLATFLRTGLVVTLVASAASATNYSVNWMQLAPTPFNAAPPFVGSYSLPGVGIVQMSYTPNPDYGEARVQNPALASGSVIYGSDTYSWNNHETLGRTNYGFSNTSLNSSWLVTYTFPGTVPAGQLILGVQGLGRRIPYPNETLADCTTKASVLQNGTHLGDWTGAQNYGATLFSGGAGNFSAINSVTGIGGANPWWNTGLALIRIDDSVSSLTVRFDQTRGDGVGVNIGSLVPEPASLSLFALGGLAALRRGRKAR